MGRGFGEHKRLARTDASKTLVLPEIGGCPNPANAYDFIVLPPLIQNRVLKPQRTQRPYPLSPIPGPFAVFLLF